MTPIKVPGCPIRVSADRRPFAPTRGFSQLTTPFVASVSLGIHHAPLLAFPRDKTRYARCRLCQHVKERTPQNRTLTHGADQVENNGLEPLTPCLQGRRSSQLS